MFERAGEAELLPGELSPRLVSEGLFGAAASGLDVLEPKLRGAAAGDPIRTPLSPRRAHGWERHRDGGVANPRRAAGDPFASDWR